MLFNLLDLDVDYGSETIDTEQYGAYVQMEALLLVRELMNICENLEQEIFKLRGEVNDLHGVDAYFSDDCPYPNPHACPWESVYVSWLFKEIYEELFSEEISELHYHFR